MYLVFGVIRCIPLYGKVINGYMDHKENINLQIHMKLDLYVDISCLDNHV